MNDKESKKKDIIKYFVFPILILIASLFLGVGYAKMSDIDLDISGSAVLTPQERNIYY